MAAAHRHDHDHPEGDHHAPAAPGEVGHPCAHAADRSASAAAALARAEALCRSRGARLTPIRRDVLGALYATHRPLGAYDVTEALGDRGGRRLAPITIYRALDFLIEHGLVHRLASRNAYVACPHGHGARDLVAFLICDACGGVDEMSSKGLADALQSLLGRERFAARTQVLEISGTCSHCRDGTAG